MWGQTPSELYRRSTREGNTNDIHNVAFPQQFYRDATAMPPAHRTDPESETSPDDSSEDSPEQYDGTWGERDIGGPVNLNEARHDYEEMRRELTQLSLQRTKSRKSHGDERPGLWKTISGASARRPTTRSTHRRPSDAAVGRVEEQEEEKDLEAGQDGDDAPDFDLGIF